MFFLISSKPYKEERVWGRVRPVRIIEKAQVAVGECKFQLRNPDRILDDISGGAVMLNENGHSFGYPMRRDIDMVYLAYGPSGGLYKIFDSRLDAPDHIRDFGRHPTATYSREYGDDVGLLPNPF